MTTETVSSTEQRSRSLLTRIGWGALIVATLYVCYFSHLGALGFVGPDEPRYAWIARDMAETGDWVTPRLYGKPWFEKPPLFYWGAAACFKLFGVSEAAARLPSAICALLATLAMGWLAWRIYGVETARWLLLLLPTTVGMIGFSHAAATDMLFSGTLTIAMVCAAVVLGLVPRGENPAGASSAAMRSATGRSARGTAWVSLLLFGFSLGLAVLAKGPAGIVLCGGAVLCWALITKEWRDAFRLLHPAAVLAFCATALPWYVLCAGRNPDFFRVFIIEHNVKRYLTPEFQHIQPFWFYIPVVLLAVLPWTGLLVWSGIVRTLQLVRERQVSARATYFVSWCLFCFAFFSVSQSKLPGYILPAIPAICIIMVQSYIGFARAGRRGFRVAQFLTAAVLLILSGVLAFFGWNQHNPNQVAVATASLIVAGTCAANLVLGIFCPVSDHGGLRKLASGFCVAPILAALLLANRLLPAFFLWDPSGRTIARELKAHGIPTDELYVRAMKRGQRYSLDFYLRSDIKTWDRAHPDAGYVLAGASVLASIAPAGWSCTAVPFDTKATGYFLYRVEPDASVSGGSSGGSRSGGSNRGG